ncbi:MAG TPA: D-aminoacylase [Casimicrobiaceae bacterium]|nr:D-aminoacylase [Casimicrobiaceae bacterium]
MNVDNENCRGAVKILRGGTVIDGTGAARYSADVRVEGDRITAIGSSLSTAGATVIDATGLVVSPGFIDVHTHDDRIVLAAPTMLPKISQGVTTVVVGNCGISLAPLVREHVPPPLNLLGGSDGYVFPTMGHYAAAVDNARPAVNVAALVGHSTLRVATMTDPYRPATHGEQQAMVSLLREGMAAGAVGMSSGVFYDTGAAAGIDELALLAGVAGEAGGVYTTHIRNEMDRVIDSLDEAFSTAQRGNLPVVISHHKCAGPGNWGRTVQTLAHFDLARKNQAIGLDCYPYIAGSTVLRGDLVDGVIDIIVTWSEPHPEMSARHLADIATEWGCTQQEACERLKPGGACYFQMREDDVQRVLRYPATMIGSDGLPHDSHPHPRLWGTFPRVLGHYCRDLGLFPLEIAVHKMTGLSARQFKLAGRGEIRVGSFADLTIFDADAVMDSATFEKPIAMARGIRCVIVNGAVSFRDGETVSGHAGRFLRSNAAR